MRRLTFHMLPEVHPSRSFARSAALDERDRGEA
jgi:hypothetical protein